ncbi:type I-F CRISPR-associated protein Csy1 [Thiolapillus sp.]|nr:type I-F CRISPR-associated protein Csy1 [Thiolapillus sp.]
MTVAPGSHQITPVITHFLTERLQPKLDKLKESDEEKRQKLIREHEPQNWIADAARRVTQIRRVTHAIKYAHPDAKGSSLFSRGNPIAGDRLAGTHSLNVPTADVVGNAAALDVYKFLRLEVNGTTLLELAKSESDALLDAFGGDDNARIWMKAFADIDSLGDAPASHKLAKQTYWPVGDDGYHLLAPLFPTALVQHQYGFIHHDRFSEAAKSAREARRKNAPYANGYREYPKLAIIKFGGTKPQNISQLNSERHGEVWLLASLPPQWTSRGLKPPCHVESIFGRWLMGFSSIRERVRIIKRFLGKTSHNNLAIRNTRADLTRTIIDDLLMLAIRIQQLPPGWSATPDCRLTQAECFWLDPGRATEDGDFAAERAATDWSERITDGFSRWLNRQLNSDKTPMADAERDHWRSSLADEMHLLREALSHD